MGAEETGGTGTVEFLVRPDGTVVGDDGASGALAAALPYTGRLARRMGELVGVGDLRTVQALGAGLLTVGVTWTPAGEGTFRAVLVPLEPRTVPAFMVVGGADTSAAVTHCVSRVLTLEGVVWSSIVTADSSVIAAVGERQGLGLAEVGTRMLAILRSLEDQHATGFVRLGYEGAAMVGASLGRHALVALVSSADDDELVSVIDEVRAILADHDLSAVTPATGPDAAATNVADVSSAPQPASAAAPPLVGARFGRAPTTGRAPGRRRFGPG